MVPLRSRLAGKRTGSQTVKSIAEIPPLNRPPGTFSPSGGAATRQHRSAQSLAPSISRSAKCLVWLVAILFTPALTLRALDADAVLAGWFASQTNLHTWSAGFTQTRTLKALSQPLQTTGRIWVALPDRFRWELGEPPQTVAVRRGDELVIAYPRLKRAERYALGGSQPKPWKDALALLDAGFPRSRAELESRFRVASVTPTNAIYVIALQPRAAATRRFLPEIQVSLATNDFSLQATQVGFPDGSTLRNDYRATQINPALDDARFAPSIDADFKVTEPAP